MQAAQADHHLAATAIAAADPVLAAFIRRAGPLEQRASQGDDFTALARAIIFQQLAGRAATTIYERTVGAVGGRMAASAVLATPVERLRAAGLSANKIAALLDLATKSTDGTLALDELPALDDEEIIRRLVVVRGIGRWTAQMFLLFELRRPDVWPVDDLGVRHGWSLIRGLAQMITPIALQAEGERFRPHRSTLARYCWQAVHIERGEFIPPAEPVVGPARQGDR